MEDTRTAQKGAQRATKGNRPGRQAAGIRGTSGSATAPNTATRAANIAALVCVAWLILGNFTLARLATVNAFSLLALPVLCFYNCYVSAFLFRADLYGLRYICGRYKAVPRSRSTAHYPHPLDHLRQLAHRFQIARWHPVHRQPLVDHHHGRRPAAGGHARNPADIPPEPDRATVPANHGQSLAPESVRSCRSLPDSHQRSTASHQRSNNLSY